MQTQSMKTNKNQQVHGDMAQKQFAVWHIRCSLTSLLNHVTLFKWKRMKTEAAHLLPQLCCMTSVSIHMYAWNVLRNMKSTGRRLLGNKPKGVLTSYYKTRLSVCKRSFFGMLFFFFTTQHHIGGHSVILPCFSWNVLSNTMYPACLI